MKCANCDSELDPGAKVCDHCGAPVETSTPASPALPSPPSPTPVVDEPAFLKSMPSEPSLSALPGDRVLGLDKDKMGIAALILGIVGLVFSCAGCGGLICIPGIVAGVIGLKTENRQKAVIGLVLSGLGLLVSIVVACLIAVSFSSEMGSGALMDW